MSRHSSQPHMLRGTGRFAFSILGGLVLASQLVLPANGLATTSRISYSTGVPASQSLALSQVAVVRLVYAYVVTPAPKGKPAAPAVLCSSLGVLVQSLPATSGFTTWVLTDGSLLNTAPAPCASAASSSSGKTTTTYKLSSIAVDANNVYTGNGLSSVSLGTYTPTPTNGFQCFASPCANGAFFFAFPTTFLQPTLSVATTSTAAQFAIALLNQDTPAARPPASLTNPTDALNFLSPAPVVPAAVTSQSEAGMPLINQNGQMVGMHLQNNVTVTSADYNAFMSQHAVFPNATANALQVAWEHGIKAYYSRNFQTAIKHFQTAESINPNFIAAKTFEQSARSLNASQPAPIGGTTTQASTNTTFFGVPKMTVLYVAGALVFLVLILLIIFFISWMRRRSELLLFRKSHSKVMRNDGKLTSEHLIPVQVNTHAQSTNHESFIQHDDSKKEKVSNINLSSPESLLCPNCGQKVPANATYCSKCGFSLTSRERNPLITLEISGSGKAQSTALNSAQSALIPTKEQTLDDFEIREILKRLWDRAE